MYFFRNFLFFLCSIVSPSIFSQTVSGKLSQLAGQDIRLERFEGLKTNLVSNTAIDSLGNFTLSYSPKDYGVGFLMSSDNKAFIVLLCGETIEIQGEALVYTESIRVTKGQQNQWFEQYSLEQPKREQALSAWLFLKNLYANEVVFKDQKAPSKSIAAEMQRIKAEDASFIAQLPKESYVRWFLPKRKLVSSVATIAQYRSDEVPQTIQDFRNLDYSDDRLYTSGLFKDAIEGHFWLLENSGKPLDKVFEEMKISIDALMVHLIKEDKKLNEVTNFLFDLLERHSLFQASEYLALKMLNEKSCTLETNVAQQLETYRTMKKGNIAPDILFEKNYFSNKNVVIDTLSELKNKYTLLVFGASWCPKCKEELPEIAKQYSKWKEMGVEVVFIALEDDPKAFVDFTASFPFFSYNDQKKWESPIVKNYFVFATPTLFLLDKNREILVRPNSVNHLNAWLDAMVKN